MATPLGARILTRYAEGTATLEQLDKALAAGWFSRDEYDNAVG